MSDYEGFYDFSGTIVSGTCGFTNLTTLMFATLHISNSFGTTIVGTLDQDESSVFSFENVTGEATWPNWDVLTNSSCAISNVALTRCGYVYAGMIGLPDYSFEPGPDSVPGVIEMLWDNPTCTVRWEGYWTK